MKEAYNPTYLHRSYNRRNRAWRKQELAVFPTFIFARLARHPSETRFRPHPNLGGFMRLGDRTLATLRPNEIEAVRRVALHLHTNAPLSNLAPRQLPRLKTKPKFEAGDQVKFAGGPFEGIMATILNCDDMDEILIECREALMSRMTTTAANLERYYVA